MTSVVINGVTVNRREIDNWINMTQLCKTVKYSPYSRWKNKPDSKKPLKR